MTPLTIYLAIGALLTLGTVIGNLNAIWLAKGPWYLFWGLSVGVALLWPVAFGWTISFHLYCRYRARQSTSTTSQDGQETQTHSAP